MLNRTNLKSAAKTSSPIFFGYISIGIPFGLVVVNAGYPWWLALLMSVFIYSGTAQYIGIALFAAGISKGNNYLATLCTILGIELVIALRHIFYSLSLVEKFKGTGRWKLPLIFTLSDETYALLSSCDIPYDAHKGEYMAVISLLNYSYWILGTIAGALIGNLIPSGYMDGVDFALTALFLVIMINQIKATKDFIPTLVGILTAIFAVVLSYIKVGSRILLPSQHVILVGLSLGIAVILLLRGNSDRKSMKKSPTGVSK